VLEAVDEVIVSPGVVVETCHEEGIVVDETTVHKRFREHGVAHRALVDIQDLVHVYLSFQDFILTSVGSSKHTDYELSVVIVAYSVLLTILSLLDFLDLDVVLDFDAWILSWWILTNEFFEDALVRLDAVLVNVIRAVVCLRDSEANLRIVG
jgi:hypothetical protein